MFGIFQTWQVRCRRMQRLTALWMMFECRVSFQPWYLFLFLMIPLQGTYWHFRKCALQRLAWLVPLNRWQMLLNVVEYYLLATCEAFWASGSNLIFCFFRTEQVHPVSVDQPYDTWKKPNTQLVIHNDLNTAKHILRPWPQNSKFRFEIIRKAKQNQSNYRFRNTLKVDLTQFNLKISALAVINCISVPS